MTTKEIRAAQDAGQRVEKFFDRVGNGHFAIVEQAKRVKVEFDGAEFSVEVVRNHLGEVADNYGIESGFRLGNDFAKHLDD